MGTYNKTYHILHEIYENHRRNYRENGDSKQMCCMWSTNDPPDDILEIKPFDDIQATFNIVIDEDDALDLYYMDLEEAAKRIMDMQKRR